MDTRRHFVLLAIALLAMGPATATIRAQVDQYALAQQILGGNARERRTALETVQQVRPQNMGPELRAALIRTLQRQGQIRAERYQADVRGEALEPLEDPEFIAGVSRVVAELRDPQSIPALVGALGTGAPPTRALLAFGEQAVTALLAAVRSPETMDDVVDEALIALRFMVEGAAPRPLSPGTLAEIRRVTKQRLTGKQYFSTLWRAIDLAIALNDPGLRTIVQSLASDRDTVRARGIEDGETVEETQRRAAERLAGVPPKPLRP